MIEARRRRFMAEINVIPLVDVVLVLLVIFMVTAPMLYRGMDINLPRSSSNTIKPEERVVLTVERDREAYLAFVDRLIFRTTEFAEYLERCGGEARMPELRKQEMEPG